MVTLGFGSILTVKGGGAMTVHEALMFAVGFAALIVSLLSSINKK